LITNVKILSFLNEISGVFNKGRGFPDVCLEIFNKKTSEGMSWGSCGTDNRSKWHVFLMDFGLSIDPWGLGVVRNETFLDVGFQGRRLNGFGDQVGDVVNRVFGKKTKERTSRSLVS